jgi:plastocyanin
LKLVGIAGVLFIAACASQPSAPATPPAETAPGVFGTATPGAIVVLTPAENQEFPVPEGHVVIDQYAKRFVPDLVAARLGQPVDFLNSDEFGHNVIVNRRGAGTSIFTTSIDKGQRYTHAFDRTGEYTVTCDLHEGMLAIIYVTTSPFSATVDPGGNFAIPGVPPGQYTMTTVVPGGGSTERKITVTAGRTTV